MRRSAILVQLQMEDVIGESTPDRLCLNMVTALIDVLVIDGAAM